MSVRIDPLKCNIPATITFTAFDFWKANPDIASETTVRDVLTRLIVKGLVADCSTPGRKTRTYMRHAGTVSVHPDATNTGTDHKEANKEPTDILYINLPDTQFTINQLVEILGIEASGVNKSFINNRLVNLTKSGAVVRLQKKPGTTEILYCKTSALPEPPAKPVENICVKCGDVAPDGQKLCSACIPKPVIVSPHKINHPDLETLVAGISNDLKCVLSVMQSPPTNGTLIATQVEGVSITSEFEDFAVHTKRCFAELIAIQKKQLLLFEQLEKKSDAGV